MTAEGAAAGTAPEIRPGFQSRLAPHLPPGLVTDILRCALAPAISPETLQAVLSARLRRAASTDVAEVVAELAHGHGGRSVPAAALQHAANALLSEEARLLAVGTAGYPMALTQAWPELGAPAWLFWRGKRPMARERSVAIVGTRRPTLDGLTTARELGRCLASAGVTVISGLARGIDQAAHAGALDAGGRTVAVLGTGFGVDYPRGDGRIRDAIAASGGLVTEYAPGVAPLPRNFLWRNRIISGLATVVVVVEGQLRSGALQTARLGAAQGREVFAVPGSLNSPTSYGPLALIRDGASVLTRFSDILEVLEAQPSAPDASREGGAEPPPDPVLARVLDLLGPSPVSAGELAAASGLGVGAVLSALGQLETMGWAIHTARGFVAAPRP